MFDVLAASPATQAVGLALVHFLWQGTLIAAGAAWLLRRLHEAPANTRYMVGCAALAGMAAAPLATALWLLDRDLNAATGLMAGVAPVLSPVGAVLSGTTGPVTSFATAGLPLVVAAWIAGVTAMTGWLVVNWLRAGRVRSSGTPAAGRWHERTRLLAARLGVTRQVQIASSGAVDVPTLIGWLRPVIVVPASVLAGLTPTQMDAVLTHELAHVRRHDYLVNVLQTVVETLFFYHPAVWWMSARVRDEREHCCDELAVAVCGDRVVYAQALASLEALRDRTPALGVAATGGDLLSRIRRILGKPAPPRPVTPAAALILAVVVGPMIVAGHALATGGDPPSGEAAGLPSPGQGTELPLRGEERVHVTIPTAGDGTEVAAPVSRPPAPAQGTSEESATVVELEDQLRLARMQGNLDAADRLLDADALATRPDGSVLNRQAILNGWRAASTDVLTLDSVTARVSGDLATVSGRQTSVSGDTTSATLFTHVWRRTDGQWRLFSLAEFQSQRASQENGPVDLLERERAALNQRIGERNSTSPLTNPDGSIRALRVGGDVQEPRRVRYVEPRYPPEAREARVQGVVILESTIASDGTVRAVRVLRSVPGLDEAAVEAVRQWQYTPTLINGQPVELIMTVTVQFQLAR